MLQFDNCQTWIAQRLAAYLASELKTEVRIEKVSVQFISSVALKGIFIGDQHKDTLLYAEELQITIRDISTSRRVLDLDKLKLKNARFKLIQYLGEEHDNLHFLVDYFSSNTKAPADTTKPPWKISLQQLTLNNVSFRRKEEGDTLSAVGVNFSDLDVTGINGDLKKISIVNDSIFASVEKLRFRDHSGFEVREVSAIAKVSSDQMRFTDLVIRSAKTRITGDLTFDYDSFPDFEEFTHNIRWQSAFKNSTVAFDDIAYFAHDLWGINRTVKLEGSFKGTVNKFKGKNVVFEWGEKSKFRGNITMTGLPDIEDTYMDVLAEDVKTNRKDIVSIPLPPFTENHGIDVPENLESLGDVNFKGKFTGFFSDFVAYGNITTAIGYISSDINLKFDPKTQRSIYSGHLSAKQFDVGKIALIKGMGNITFNADVEGKGLELKTIDARLTGNVDALEYNGYTYHSIKVDGEIAKKLFSGSVTLRDPNLDMDFAGTVDFRGKLPLFDFTSAIRNANLDTLHLVDIRGHDVLQTTIRSHLTGNKLDNLEGTVDIQNTFLLVDQKMYRIGNIHLNAAKLESGEKDISLESDFLNGQVKGYFEWATLGDAFKQILPRYLPSVVLPLKHIPSNQDFSFSLYLKNMTIITENFLPSWYVDPMTMINGRVNTSKNTFSMEFTSPEIRYNKIIFQNGILKLSGTNDLLSLSVHSKEVHVTDSTIIPGVTLNSTAKNNRILYDLKLSDLDTVPNRATLSGSIDFQSANRFKLKIDSSAIFLQNQYWALDNSNSIEFDSALVSIHNLNFSKTGEAIKIEGVIGDSVQNNLALEFSSFRLSNFNPFLKAGNSLLGGVINGKVIMTNARKNPQFESDLMISDFSINNDTLGNASLITRFNNEQKIVVVSAIVTKGSAKVIDIRGNYYAAQNHDNLDFNVKLNNFYLRPLERYISDIMSDLSGKVSAELRLTGTFDKPVLDGTVDFSRASCVVNYLGTRYSFTSRVLVTENTFDLTGLKIIDAENNEAIVSGKIYHNYFQDFLFDVEIRPRKFHMLNTNAAQNSLYYGTAFVSGYAHFLGSIENMTMDINLSPDKGSELNIPLSNKSDVSQSDFITFIDHQTKTEDGAIVRNLVNLNGVKLNMNLDLNQNALINIIFDEKIGDVISGYGTGSLRLDINTAGNFNMYGTYTIEKGEYLFTLQNLINKRFKVDAGSKITWAGDPYEATVDLSAVYVVYTSSLYKIIPDSTYKRRIPVDCRLLLTNKLMNPTINYEINVRGVDATEQSYIRGILNSEQEISKQMFGLLVFNQFLPTSGTGITTPGLDAGSGAGASASELLSNQVSNWLSQVSKNVNIGFNYRARDTYSKEEIQVMFSKSLFNDRLIVEGNVGYMGNAPSQSNSNVVGDFYAEYKVNEDGRFRLKGFNRSNTDNVINYTSPYTQGIGVFYRQEFNSLRDLLIRLKLMKKPKEEVEPAP